MDKYTGFVEGQSQFGVIDHKQIYELELEDGSTVLHIEGDRHDDGSATGSFNDSERIRLRDSKTGEESMNTTTPSTSTRWSRTSLVTSVSQTATIPVRGSSTTTARRNRATTSASLGRYNVLGWYARHIFHLDEKEPEVEAAKTVTGFYGINDSKKPAVNRSGILIAFDGAVDADTVGEDTFAVTLDPETGQSSGAQAQVIDTTVNGSSVYLLLGEELASNATPNLMIASGKSISDPAGNTLSSGGALTADNNDTSIEVKRWYSS